MATDLFDELYEFWLSSCRLGDPPELDEFPSSPEPELLLLLLAYVRVESWEPLGEGGKDDPKHG